jgi:amino acid adenylation domain-containing protein/thioester reductase-like protein
MTAETVQAPDRASDGAAREELIRQRIAGRRTGARATIAPVARGGRLPVSFGQQRLWFLNVLDPQSPEYLVPMVLRLRGDLDADRLREAWRSLVARHEILRTRYQLTDAEPVQVIDEPRAPDLPVTDLRSVPGADRERRALDLARQQTAVPFELSLEHPVRARLIRLLDDEHLFVVVLHHIACDGWSLDIMVRELFTLYTRGAGALPAPAIQYADYAVWQRNRLVGAELTRQLDYWRGQLAGVTPLDLPTDRPRPAVRDWAGDRVVFEVPAALGGSLRDLARSRDVTLFALGLTAFQVLLSRYTGQRDITVGSAVTGRARPEIQDVVGFFLNTVVLRARWSGDPTFTDLLERNRRTVLSAFEYQDAPIQMLVDDAGAARDRSRTPLFQVMFDLAEAAPPGFDLPGLGVDHVDLVTAASKHDLRLELAERPDGSLRGVLEYPTALFDASTVRRLADHYVRLLAAVTADPGQRLSTVDMLASGERAWLAGRARGAGRVFPDRWIGDAVADYAETSGATAVSAGPDRLSYTDLHLRANRMAHHLRAHGAGPGSVVGVCLGRGIDLLPTLLGVWRAGAAYVPVDPADPPGRMATILADANAEVVVTSEEHADRIPAGPVVICLEDDADAIDCWPDTDSGVRPDPASTAYLIFTSGSTGRPKGVRISHGALHNYVSWAAETYIAPGGAGAALFSSTAFDLVITTLFVPLLAGQTVHVLPADVAVGDLGPALVAAAGGGRYSFLKLTPGHLDVISRQLGPDEAATLASNLVVGGEGFPSRLAMRWNELTGGGTTIVNEYGPTENTVANVAYLLAGPVPAGTGELLPIGSPTANTTANVLDSELNRAPTGVVGHLFLGGAQVALGYQGLPGVTADRFVPDPHGHPGTRMYRTGDRARVLTGGDIEYLGRADEQVKIRGYRIEPAEITAALTRHPDVSEAVVTVRDTAAGGRALVGYVVPVAPGAVDTDDVRIFLDDELPAYMIPSALVVLDELPLTSNGKTDLVALPDPDRHARSLRAEPLAPASPLEERIAEVWRGVLHVSDVGVRDNFFELGGDSLNAVALVGDLRDLGYDVTVQNVFEFPTVAGLAALVADRPEAVRDEPRVAPFELLTDADRALLPDGLDDAFPLSMLQAGMVVEMLGGGAVNYYHNATTYPILDDAPFSLDALRRAAQVLADRHEVIRTGFDVTTFSEPLQLVHGDGRLPVDVVDLRGFTSQEQNEAIRRYMADERTRLFDLARPPLLRVLAHVCSDSEWSLTITECHPILEGWSYHMLLMELLTVYRSLRDGREPEPYVSPGIRFVDFIAAERRSLTSDEDRAYWRGVVSGHSRFSPPTAWAGSGDRPYRAEVMFADLEEGLRRLATEAEVPLKSVMHAAHLKVLSMLTDEPEFFDGLVCDTRPEVAGADRLYGLFLNTVPFPFRMTARTWRDLVRDVFAREVDLWPHRRFPMGVMQRELARGGRLVEVMFNYLDFRTVDTEVVDFGASIDDSPTEFKLAVTAFRQGLLTLRIHPEAVSRENGERLAAMYRMVLAAMAADPDGDALATHLPAEERRRLLVDWNDTAVARPAATLVDLFEARVRATPDADAVVTASGTRMSYRDLDRRANRLGHYLGRQGVGPGAVVGVCQEPGVDLLVSVLGVVKSGAAYLPLDPGHPTQRLAFALEDAGAAWVLTQDRVAGVLPAGTARVLRIDTGWPAVAGEPDTPPAHRADPLDVVYVIYTSGSTGRPKGVLVTHHGLANYLTWAAGEYVHEGRSGAPLLGSVAFDLAVTNLLLPLVTGRAVRLLPVGREVAAVAELLAGPSDPSLDKLSLDKLSLDKLSLVKLTPGHLDLLAGLLPAGTVTDAARTYVVGGEQLALETVSAWRALAPDATVVNEYGPTETVVGCSVYEVPADADPALRIPIGRPIANTRMYVLDRNGFPVPVGVVGELHIGGDGVARGYHDRPGLTAAKFVPDPFGPPGGRLYRTGDLARYRADGNLDFLDRIDDQVKVNGYRIEPGEIEARLLARPEVAETVVVARDHDGGPKRLVAYVAPAAGAELSVPGLGEHLRRELPAYMVPDLFVTVAELPRTAAGKIDRAALPDPAGDRPGPDTGFVAPRGSTERRIAEIWERVLGVERIGVLDDVVRLGADSISGIKVAAAAAALGFDMSPMDAVAYPTVAELARHLLGGGKAELVAEIAAGAVLPADITPGADPADADGPVLLTGVTGFVGSYLLRELLQDTNRRVVCLVRAASDGEAVTRLNTVLNERGIALPPDDRVEVMAGDLALPRFGLDADRYDSLAATIGSIVHAGALTNAVWAYRAMRPTNVDGTAEVLRLACTGPAKWVHHVSTLSVFELEAFDAHLDEDSVQVDPPWPSNGYGQSKWAAEELVRAAGRRGLRTTIYRMGKVSWDTVTGGYNPDDTVLRAVAACIDLGMSPRVPYAMTLTPVDHIAGGIVAAMKRPDSVGRCVHIVSPHRVEWSDVTAWTRDRGHALEPVTYAEWRSAMVARSRQAGGEHLTSLAMLMPAERDGFDVEDGMPDDYVPPVPTWLETNWLRCRPISAQDFHLFLDRLTG